jgi:hypothetical protein
MGRGVGLRVPARPANPKGATEDTIGERYGGDGGTRVAIKAMVEHGSWKSEEDGKAGESGGGVREGTVDGGEPSEAAPGQHAYGLAVIQQVTDERHRPGTVFVVEVCRIGGMREIQLEWWFSLKTGWTRRQRLHGWRLWQAYCVENEVQPEGMKGFSNLGMEVAYFIQAMSQMSTPFYLIKEALTAVKELFEVIAPWALLLLKESIMVIQAILAATTGMVRGAKYRDIWDSRVVMKFVRKGPPSEELPLKKLKGRAVFLFMVLLPCRPMGMWKMDVLREKWAEDGETVLRYQLRRRPTTEKERQCW